MNGFYAASAVSVPTKRDAGPPSAPGASGPGGPPTLRRNSSSNSLDVAATIFSSMQELEATGRNLSSLGALSTLGGSATAALEAGMGAGRGMGGMGGYGGLGAGDAAALARMGALRSASRTSSSGSLSAMEKMLAQATSAGGQSGVAGSGYPSSIQAQAEALRRLEVEEMMLQQQQQQQQQATQGGGSGGSMASQTAALLGNLKGGYAPMASSRNTTSGRDPRSLDDFTPEELLQEVERRQSQRRNSRDFLASVGGGGRDRRPSAEAMMMDAFSRQNSRDDLVEMYHQMRRHPEGSSSAAAAAGAGGADRMRGRNSLDSLSSLALIASAKNELHAAAEQQQHQQPEGATPASSMHAAAGGEAANHNNGNAAPSASSNPKNGNGQRRHEDIVVMVPTSKPESKLVGKKNAKERDTSDGSNSTVVTDTQSPKPGDKDKALADKLHVIKRSNSNASFDALLSVLGDEIAEQGGQKRKAVADHDDDKSHASAGSVGFFNNLIERTAADSAAARQREEEDKILATAAAMKRQRRLSSSSSISDGLTPLGQRKAELDVSALERNDHDRLLLAGGDDRLLAHMDALRARGLSSRDAPLFPAKHISEAEYKRRLNDTADMMASLEALRQEELLMKERALRESAFREFAARERMARGGGDGEMARLAALLGRPLPPPGLVSQRSFAAEEMMARLHNLPLQNGASGPGIVHATSPEKKTDDPARVRPDIALKEFLDEYGGDAEKARERMLGAIKETEDSLATIHAWDRSQGLRKCHSRTVVKTRRTRAKIKAFLMGVDPPKEPTKKRKKGGKGKKAGDDQSVSLL